MAKKGETGQGYNFRGERAQNIAFWLAAIARDPTAARIFFFTRAQEDAWIADGRPTRHVPRY